MNTSRTTSTRKASGRRKSSLTSLLSFKSIRRASVTSWHSVASTFSTKRRQSSIHVREKCADNRKPSLFEVDGKVLKQIRQKLLTIVEQQPTIYHSKDVESIREDDWFLVRFVLAASETSNNKLLVDSIVATIDECLKWRLGIGINDLKDTDIPRELYAMGSVVRGTDVKGNPVLYLRTGRSRKVTGWTEVSVKFLVYMIESAIKSAGPFRQVGIFIDTSEASVSHVNMPLILRLIPLISKFYPSMAEYIYVYELPWLFSKCCSMAVAMLSDKTRRLVKMVDKRTFRELAGSDLNIPDYLGGQLETWIPMPANDKQCVSLEDFARLNSVSEQDIRKGRKEIDKLLILNSK